MYRLFIALILVLILSYSAQALFLIENNDCRRPGRAAVSAAQVAGGTVVNMSWGVWDYTNIYMIVGPGAGLGLKQRLINENQYWPCSLELTLESTSLKMWHTAAYGVAVRKNILDDVEIFIKGESVDNRADWTGLEQLQQASLVQVGTSWKFWHGASLVLQACSTPDLFGTFGINIIL